MSAARQVSSEIGPARGKERTKGLLSVVVLSTGTRGDLERATSILAPVLSTLRGQLVIASSESLPVTLQGYADSGQLTFVRVSRGSARAALAEAAMAVVRGDIVAIREDVAVRDAEWLAPYRNALHLDDVVADRVPAQRVAVERSNDHGLVLAPPSVRNVRAPAQLPEATTGM